MNNEKSLNFFGIWYKQTNLDPVQLIHNIIYDHFFSTVHSRKLCVLPDLILCLRLFNGFKVYFKHLK